ncbi:hypothetical protein BaRGS_00031719 [Batillaria attramentaria]|uniref:Uncharacterized protein n=1 Tax=Batillaria attramentaria TaxID=370345 RepID=A0ABD0JQK1_9CAEN
MVFQLGVGSTMREMVAEWMAEVRNVRICLHPPANVFQLYPTTEMNQYLDDICIIRWTIGSSFVVVYKRWRKLGKIIKKRRKFRPKVGKWLLSGWPRSEMSGSVVTFSHSFYQFIPRK